MRGTCESFGRKKKKGASLLWRQLQLDTLDTQADIDFEVAPGEYLEDHLH